MRADRRASIAAIPCARVRNGTAVNHSSARTVRSLQASAFDPSRREIYTAVTMLGVSAMGE